ncbi:hypothetical protein CP8484711_0046 [Chlamydia psittaci 84-8471/1]|nr:hypothetical protein CP8484711_0046 [Chlamydia psittaci 84-8471/1]
MLNMWRGHNSLPFISSFHKKIRSENHAKHWLSIRKIL